MATYQSTTGTRAGTSFNTIVAFAAGAVFVLVGLLGFTVSGEHTAVGHEGGALLGLFQVNVLHNVVHIAVGAVMIGAAVAGGRIAKATNVTIGAVYLLLGLVGLMLTGDTPLNIIALNGADNGLHIFLGVALIGLGVGLDRR
ncbi:hypothetical protein Val02_42190 [Virgisporangium aliadipatigenens]|uniref:DUF4383 domain-containing protein n=1 Tax=Virgisporangium aliadipatigenens TaxID=741659 RepID=A0A8J3YPB3_9ACTN|nr:DUF4383 domain-containing protein [Virgisporangium aliadipatigenens]GIJ47333.1 hypothetical protein Val02_42190 [Virgisporangium aliadipatigenens]